MSFHAAVGELDIDLEEVPIEVFVKVEADMRAAGLGRDATWINVLSSPARFAVGAASLLRHLGVHFNQPVPSVITAKLLADSFRWVDEDSMPAFEDGIPSPEAAPATT